MKLLQPPPALNPEDLGLKLDEDSEDFDDADAAEAVDTVDADDLARRAAAVAGQVTRPTVKYALLRKAGILYCKLRVEGPSGVRTAFYRLPWLRRPTP